MKKKSTDALAALHRRYYEGRPERLASLERERVNAKIARDIFVLRSKKGLTQKQLARMIGTTPSVISRLESADYAGHSLGMLQRVAGAFNQRIQVRFVPLRAKARITESSRF